MSACWGLASRWNREDSSDVWSGWEKIEDDGVGNEVWSNTEAMCNQCVRTAPSRYTDKFAHIKLVAYDPVCWCPDEMGKHIVMRALEHQRLFRASSR